MNYEDMIQAAESEAYNTESISYGIKGCVKNRELGSTQYVQKIKQFLFFIKNCTLPHGADMFDIGQYKRVTEKLIKNGYFNGSAIEIFKK